MIIAKREAYCHSQFRQQRLLESHLAATDAVMPAWLQSLLRQSYKLLVTNDCSPTVEYAQFHPEDVEEVSLTWFCHTVEEDMVTKIITMSCFSTNQVRIIVRKGHYLQASLPTFSTVKKVLLEAMADTRQASCLEKLKT